jgi:DNA-binding transcriptional regulator YiaG
MAKMESIIKSEIQRLAKREVRSVFLPLRRDVWGMKLKLSNLSKNFSVMNRLAMEISKAKSTETKLEASPEEVKASRITPDRIRGLRKKLGISQRDLGILIGVSLGTVASWEKGKFRPQGEKKAALVALRKTRKRIVKKMLKEKAGEKDAKKLARPPQPKMRQKKIGRKKK